MKHFLGNHRFTSYLLGFVSVIVFSVLVYIEVKYASPYAATWDQVDFALALHRYDLLVMQPHFPGYPYFILGGMIVSSFMENPAKALSVFNVVMMLSATIPIFLLVKKYYKSDVAWMITCLIQSSSFLMLIVTQPMSEGAAIAALWWYLWAVQTAKERLTLPMHLLPLFFLGVLLGIRLSYLPFAAALLFLWYDDWKTYKKIGRLMIWFVAALFFQLIWVGAVALTEGSITGFIKLALAFTSGHFQEWGGAVTAGDDSIVQRFFTLIFYNVFWTGIASQSIWLLIIYIILMLFIVRKNKEAAGIPNWLLITGVFYFLWAWLAQNIEKPRHIAPLVTIILFYIWGRYFSVGKSMYKKWFALTVFIIQVIVGSIHVYGQATHLPATYQLTYDLQKVDAPFVVYTWEETRVMEYLDADFIHKRVLHFDVFLQDKANYKHATIYLTDHVVKGFATQGISLEGHLRKVKTYQSSTLADPVYGEITLYEWID
ncbi:hypothetical protein B0I26_103288 [Anoxybacillus vitaminiphilus]|uniref:Dolichyl-phosphate-mannose-protein mannosyltransferase n=1 Tax=Paranoxybacillus vitaminiphilus TaxID=581036 RepID=A0A327YK67_9BACL|nr:nucleoporin-interacting protein [Anoxybacillus vitaminiphilus]RAK21330.1 hypothetical protein B0I26_103288 [Anoxybacillus vitaminiphilus]